MIQPQVEFDYSNADTVIFIDADTSLERRALAAYARWVREKVYDKEQVMIANIEDRHVNKPFKVGCLVINLGDPFFEDEEIESRSVISYPAELSDADILDDISDGLPLPATLEALFNDPTVDEVADSLRLGLRVVDTDPVVQYSFWESFLNSELGTGSFNTFDQLVNMGRIIRIDRGVRTQKATYKGRLFKDYYVIDSFDPCWETLRHEVMHLRARYMAVAETQHHMGLTRLFVRSLDEAGEDYEHLQKLWPDARWQGKTMLLEVPTGQNIERISDKPYYEPLPEDADVTKVAPSMTLELDVSSSNTEQ